MALRLSNLTDPLRVVSFLLLPVHRAFDPSLAFLAMGVLPLTILLYCYRRGPEKPHVGGEWTIPQDTEVDIKLVVGAGIFGVGWGLAGICRECEQRWGQSVLIFFLDIAGPGLVNLGRAIVAGTRLRRTIGWAIGVAVGGMMA